MGLHPLITRPTRITCQSKTLIDNIFTSDVTSHIQSGLLINDTSDHLPIFQMTDIGINGNTNNSIYNKKRIVTDRNICEIISELEKTEWDEILNSDDVNVSYETFVNKLTDIYRNKCPIVTSKGSFTIVNIYVLVQRVLGGRGVRGQRTIFKRLFNLWNIL